MNKYFADSTLMPVDDITKFKFVVQIFVHDILSSVSLRCTFATA